MNSELQVNLGEQRSYPIHIGTALIDDAANWRRCIRTARAAIVTNQTVADIFLDRLLVALPLAPDVIKIGDGEEFKSLETFSEIIDQLIETKHDRSTTIVALGGGVVGDIAGFVAATYMRGVDLVQVPTTLLAQVDSAVGGKTGVNHTHGKNLIGAFYQPRTVVIDVEVLQSLPQRIFVEGLAEVIKYGVINDVEFFEWLENNHEKVLARDTASLEYIVRRSCEIKADVVALDEREQGVRAILNFGHTFGHAIEALTGYGAYLHGEAVALGMRMAADLSVRLDICASNALERIERILDLYGLNSQMPSLSPLAMIDAMGLDKKVHEGTIRLVLISRIGKVEVVNHKNHDALVESLESRIRPQRVKTESTVTQQ